MKLPLALLAVMLAVAAAAFLAYRLAPGRGCDDRLLAEAASPGGRAVAAAFTHRCGAAVTTEVALRQGGSFSAEERGVVFVAAGGAAVKLDWIDPRTLVIETPARDVLREERGWRNVRVLFRRLR